MHVEEITNSNPQTNLHASENKVRRKQSVNALGPTNSLGTGSKSSRKTNPNQFNKNAQLKP